MFNFIDVQLDIVFSLQQTFLPFFITGSIEISYLHYAETQSPELVRQQKKNQHFSDNF